MSNLPKLIANYDQAIQNRNNQSIEIKSTQNSDKFLSPFTWTNIKLPNFNIQSKNVKQTSNKKLLNIEDYKSYVDKHDKQYLQTIKQKKYQSSKNRNQYNTIKNKTIDLDKQKALNALNEFKSKQLRKHTSQKNRYLQSRSLQNEQEIINPKLRRLNRSLKIKNSQLNEQKNQQLNAKNQQLNVKNLTSRNFYKPNIRGISLGKQKRSIIQQKRSIIQYSRQSSTKGYNRSQLNSLNSTKIKSINSIHHDASIIRKYMKSQHNNYSEMEPYIRRFFQNNCNTGFFVTSNPKYQPKHQNQDNFNAFAFNVNILIWTKNQNLSIFRQKSKEKYYNHIQGSSILTSKQNLHQILSANGQYFYPQSFILTKDYKKFTQAYDWNLIKIVLKIIVNQIKCYQKANKNKQIHPENQNNQSKQNISKNYNDYTIQNNTINQINQNICLGNIVDDLTKQKNPQTLKLIKFCLLLQFFRNKQKLIGFFQRMPNFQSLDINVPQTMYTDVIQWCINYHQTSNKNQSKTLNNGQQKNSILQLNRIDYRLLQLLKSYDYLFQQSFDSYQYESLSNKNCWIIKPPCSSKGAGILLIQDSHQFYTTKDYQYKQYRHGNKYQNKIVQKYIQSPFIIKFNAIDFWARKLIKNKLIQQQSFQTNMKRYIQIQEKYQGRKFDIRQWVLIVSDDKSSQLNSQTYNINQSNRYANRKYQRSKSLFKVYYYYTAYCRFSNKKYSIDSNDLKSHLTNYELYKNNKKDKSLNRKNNSLNESIISNLLADQCLSTKKDNQSVLMLDQFFKYLDFIDQIKNFVNKQKQQVQSQEKEVTYKKRYEQQLNHLLKSTINSCTRYLKSNPKTFQLFGFDLLLDEKFNLYLLQVNLNPQCNSERYTKLKLQAQNMVADMLKIITNSQKDIELKGVNLEWSQTNSSQKVTENRQNKWILI